MIKRVLLIIYPERHWDHEPLRTLYFLSVNVCHFVCYAIVLKYSQSCVRSIGERSSSSVNNLEMINLTHVTFCVQHSVGIINLTI